MKELNQHIKSGNFARVYLLYGKEAFLIGHWQKRLIEAVVEPSLNLEILDGKIPVAQIINSAETLPFMAEHRMILVKDSGLFEGGRKDDSEAMAKYIPDIPPSTVLVFVEKKVDKRGRLFKRVKDAGFVAEAAPPKEPDLADWAMRLSASRGKNLSRAAAYHLIRNISTDMGLLFNEIEKLVSYAGENAEISIADIDALCTKSLDVKVFDLTKAMAAGNAAGALSIYAGLMAMKESPLMVLAMIARQFRFFLQCGHLAAAGIPQNEITSRMGFKNSYATKEFVAGSRKFSTPAMIAALEDCLNTDYSIKSGKIEATLGVETLIVKLANIPANIN
ncbi:MAG: DNA polymerase III subunit delta [Clostridiales bacterium]|jgi:DNA polymerase-3 subunit delta|nr:DNA polymerase III subunit delta [Clostridiales bacterium]